MSEKTKSQKKMAYEKPVLTPLTSSDDLSWGQYGGTSCVDGGSPNGGGGGPSCVDGGSPITQCSAGGSVTPL